MPFTASHAAAVLPLVRTRLPPSALVAGSVAPDLPYFLPVGPDVPTHTAAAVVGVDLLLGLLLWAGWHGLVATPALHTAPRRLRARLAGRVRPGLRHRLTAAGPLALVVVAVVVGAATHVVWDEFTHGGRFGTEHLAVLADSWAGRPGYRWAQDASGVLGAVVLAGWLVRWWRRTPPGPVEDRAGRWEPAAVVAATAVLAGVSALPGEEDLRLAAIDAAFRGGGCALAAVVVLSLAWHLRGRATAALRRPRY
ncbi:DUF4184 family protein [Trujillonella endophytica]|uniref:DUF4184 family protein n=1 Tax=Trujillonella endophytica TaxID=673521 RepID=A0A1H8RFP5_9ACTN|nr:DUF4184 family protein [Trujillella endophytica]SEO64968.1 protein of unknown function [Trujillella endophytica]